jgi:hypothetical protein
VYRCATTYLSYDKLDFKDCIMQVGGWCGGGGVCGGGASRPRGDCSISLVQGHLAGWL